MHRLDVPTGRTFRATCDADFGDARCGIALTDPRYRTTGAVLAVLETSRLKVTLADTFAAGWFSGGGLTWTGGANAGSTADLRAESRDGATAQLDLWEPPPRPVVPGDAFRLTAGCDKRLATCRDRFANAVNFQGFPHMPGNDFVLRGVGGGPARLDGGSLFR